MVKLGENGKKRYNQIMGNKGQMIIYVIWLI